MKIPNEMIVNSVEHRYGGNGWAVVGDLGDDLFGIVSHGGGKLGTQVFKAWSKLLSLEKKIINVGTPEQPKWIKSDVNVPIRPDVLEVIKQVRANFKSGKVQIVNTRLVPVP